MNRVLRAAAAAATVALAVAGCGAGQIPGHGAAAADATTPGGGGLPTPAKGSEAAPQPTATVSGQAATLGKATIPLTGVAKASKDGDHLCLTLANDTGCSLEVIDIGATRAGGGSVSNPAPGDPNGWWWGSDVPSCGDDSQASAVTRSTVLEKGFKKVGPKTAAYAHWQVSCENADLDFDPRLWWLPTSMIAFREHSTTAGAGQAVDRILAGVTFSA